MFSLKQFFANEQDLNLKNTPNSQKIALNLFMVGFIILGFGLALIPSSIYYKLLAIFIYLPALYLIVSNYKVLFKLIKSMSILWCYIAFIVWTLISLSWAHDIELTRELKFPILISLFCFGCLIFMLKSTQQFEKALLLIAFLLAVSASIAMIYSPWNPPFYTNRMTAFNRLENPILAGYAMGIAFIILYSFISTHKIPFNSISTIALLILLTFVIWTKSRGAIGGLIIYLFLTPIWNRSPRNFLLTFIILIGSIIFLFFYSHIILDRGFSYRPLILEYSTKLMFTHPLTGVGLATDYSSNLLALGFPTEVGASHSHNLFLHIGIITGVTGLLLFLILWINVGWQAWKNRTSQIGQLLIGIFIYSCIGLQFDAIYIWSKPNVVWLMTWLPLIISFYLSAKNRIDKPN